MFCHIVTPTAWKLPQYFDIDYYPFAFIMLLGLTQVGVIWGSFMSRVCISRFALV
jgi:hypothetical protein